MIFIATRKHKKDEEHIYESWKTQFEMESSNFSSRNKYPNNCRFICSSITNAENSLYMKELTEFWVSVLTLAINRIPASSLQAYRLYKLGMEASEEELEEQTEEVKEYIPGHVKEHIVNVETISQPEAQSEDEDNEEEIVHYEDALEELENVLKHETEEDEKDKEVAKG